MGARKLQVVGVGREAIKLRDDMTRRTADWPRSAVESESEVVWTFIMAIRRLPKAGAHKPKTVDYEPGLSSSNTLSEARHAL